MTKKYINFSKDEILFTGHSLGGMLATFMGIEYDKRVVTFESPGSKHYIELIGLDYKSKQHLIYNFGHTADIIFTGNCNGALSLCYLGGYNMETRCHIGNTCIYDTKTLMGMKDSIFTHKIKFVIENVIEKWNNTIPSCSVDTLCQDCVGWNYL